MRAASSLRLLMLFISWLVHEPVKATTSWWIILQVKNVSPYIMTMDIWRQGIPLFKSEMLSLNPSGLWSLIKPQCIHGVHETLELYPRSWIARSYLQLVLTLLLPLDKLSCSVGWRCTMENKLEKVQLNWRRSINHIVKILFYFNLPMFQRENCLHKL